MDIIDLDEKHLDTYLVCLEDWSEDIKDAGNHKRLWYQRMKEKGLRVKLAVEGEKTCGMIQYVPIAHAFAEGREAYFIHCIWVHGHKQGVGNHQKRGLGKALLRAAAEFGGKVEFEEISTFDRGVFLDWGIADALFIDGKQVRTGPPPSFDKIRKKIARKAKRLKN